MDRALCSTVANIDIGPIHCRLSVGVIITLGREELANHCQVTEVRMGTACHS